MHGIQYMNSTDGKEKDAFVCQAHNNDLSKLLIQQTERHGNTISRNKLM
jgi:hypothetical protein